MIIPFSVTANTEDLWFAESKDEKNTYIVEGGEAEIEVSVALETIEGTNTVRQTNTVKNIGDTVVVISRFSSARIEVPHGRVAVCNNHWTAEGQWSFFAHEQLGLVQTSAHAFEPKYHRISSVGTHTTGNYFPLTMVIGDDGYTYYMETGGGVGWSLTHISTGGINSPLYMLEASCADELTDGWYYELKPGESYTAVPAVYGRVKGGFEEACAEIVRYRRAVTLTHFDGDVIPVVFNDYMNCLWGRPSAERLLPLIDAAADVGCEYFCIDAGWHKNAGEGGGRNGDWIIDEERFGDIGLGGVFEHMKKRGLKPGVWFEFDNVKPNAAAYSLSDDCVLSFRGKKYAYSFFNFSCVAVREHLASRVRELHRMGLRYIKNDFNRTSGIGCDDAELSYSEAIRRNHEAFLDFIDELRAEFPDIVIENCGSGALRSDNNTLKHFYLQSTSDQEIYYFYPSIITGSAAMYAPEKAGIWSYPYPVYYDDKDKPESARDEAWRASFADGEETIFNMVNGMCGVLYQSGRLDLADESGLSLVRDGIAAYKRMRGDIIKGHPILPTGTALIGETGFATYGIETEDRSRAYLAVWRVGAESDEITLDLSKYGYTKASAYYPSLTEASFSDGRLEQKLPKKYSARMILLEK